MRGAMFLSKGTLRNQEEEYDIPGLGCKRGQKFQCSLSSKSEPAGQNQYIMISRNIVSHQKHICAIKMDTKEMFGQFWIYLLRVPETPIVNQGKLCETLPENKIQCL